MSFWAGHKPPDSLDAFARNRIAGYGGRAQPWLPERLTIPNSLSTVHVPKTFANEAWGLELNTHGVRVQWLNTHGVHCCVLPLACWEIYNAWREQGPWINDEALSRLKFKTAVDLAVTVYKAELETWAQAEMEKR